MIQNFVSLGFPGQVVAVNPKYREILGFPCYPNLREIPFVPDAVLVGVNKAHVVSVIEEAAAIGVRGAVVLAIGFAEASDEGRRQQERMQHIAEEAGMSVIGPNCLGYINFCLPGALYPDPVRPYQPGYAGLFSQSGSVAIALANNARGVRWSHIVSSGNEAVTGGADLLAYFVDHPHTNIICSFLETIREPERFFAECDRAREAGKPFIVLKSGRTEASHRVALAHSGALAVSDRLIDELFTRHHVLRVDSLEEMLNTVTLIGVGRRPKGDRMAVVSTSGGQIELILDEAAKHGIRVPDFGEDVKRRLRGLLPDSLVVGNPLDLWGIQSEESNYPMLLHALASDPNIDLLLSAVQTSYTPTVPGDADGHRFHAAKAVAAATKKPVVLVTSLDGGASADLVEDLASHGVAMLSGFPGAMRAVERLITYARPPHSSAERRELAVDRLRQDIASLGGRPTSGQRALDLVAAVGIPTVRSMEVRDEREAVQAAARLGYPVVVKIGDPAVLHKTEAGGVILGLQTEAAVERAVRQIRGSESAQGAPILIQSQVTGGLEMILGMQTEGELGSFVLAGTGGIWAEVLNDVSIRPAGLLKGEAGEMVKQLQTSRWLRGYRGAPPLDIVALIDAIERLDCLALHFGTLLVSVDVNPLIVLPEGVVAVDALVVPSPTATVAG